MCFRVCKWHSTSSIQFRYKTDIRGSWGIFSAAPSMRRTCLFSVVKLSHSLWLTNRLLQRQVQRIKVSGILRHGEVKFQRRKDRFQHLYVYYKLSTLLAEWYKLPKLWSLSLLRQSDYARTHWVSNRRFTIFTNKLLPWPGIPLISKVNRRRKFAVLKNGATNFQHGRSRPCQGLLW